MSKFSNKETALFDKTEGDYWFDYVSNHMKESPSIMNAFELAEIMRSRIVDKFEKTKTETTLFDELLGYSVYAINFYEVAKNILSEVEYPA